MPVGCFIAPQLGIAAERARRPDLAGVPLLLVLEEGTVRAVSDEAAARGVCEGNRTAGARALCPDAVALPYDPECCETAATPMRDALAVESSFVEPDGPELCFVELDGCDIASRCQALREAVEAATGVPVWAGLARNKLVAEAAALRRDGSRFTAVAPGREAAFLEPVPVDQIRRFDVRTLDEMRRLGIQTLGDLARVPVGDLQRRFRQTGLLLHRVATGTLREPVRPLWPPRTLVHAVHFESEVNDRSTLEAVLGRCAARIAVALSASREYCRTLTLTLTFPAAPVSGAGSLSGTLVEARATEKLGAPANTAGALHRAALRIYKRMRVDRPFLGVRLEAAEVGLGRGVQLALLDDNEHGVGLPHERAIRLQAAVQQARRRFGAGSVRMGGTLLPPRRIGLWTSPIGRLLNDPIQVDMDGSGVPVRYWWRGERREVARIQNRWRETDWSWGQVAEQTVFRVETLPPGLCELRRMGSEWRLGAVAD